MLTGALVNLLDKAENPRMVRTLIRALEFTTGLSTKEVIGSFNTVTVSDWYARNGYKLINASLFGGYSSYSGKTITADTALESAAFFAGVKIIAEDMGTLPHFLYRRSKDGLKVERATDHPLYRILHDLWNPEVSAGEGVEALTAHALMTGDGFAYIARRPDGTVGGLYPWQPEDVSVKRNEGGSLFYVHRENNIDKSYSRDQVLHLRGFTLTGVNGENLLNRARQVLGLTLATQEYPARYFSQGSLMDVVLERPAGLPPLGPEGVKLLKDAWKTWHQGLQNAHEPAVIQEGMTAKLLTPDHSKNQLVEQRKFQVLEVCRLLRLPPHKLADLERAAYNSIIAENTAYITNTLSPWERRWSEAVYRCLLTPGEQLDGRLYSEHSVESLLRGDFETQIKAFVQGLANGLYTINEVRRWLNLNPIEGGDVARVQINMGDITQAAQAATSQPQK